MSNITIVTAFYDIGRGDWKPEKGLPHYLERSVDTYIERFSHTAKLENEMVVFSTPDIIEKLRPLRAGKEDKTKFVEFDPRAAYAKVREEIVKVHQDKEYQDLIYKSQRLNPEYWNADYVLVTNLKATFVDMAIKNNLVSNDMVAWIDFGYCRDASKIPPSMKWEYDFDPTKIHLFKYHDYQEGRSLQDLVASNDVHILGAKAVASKEMWSVMSQLMNKSFQILMSNKLVDDDQTLFLISTLLNPELFELHQIPDHQKGLDPFVLFNEFNKV